MDGRTKITYKRLPGRGPRNNGILAASFSRCTLYLGNDHLLAVDNHPFSEDYKRFYFSDIQAIITRKTRRGAVWSIALSLMCASSLPVALFLQNRWGHSFFLVVSGAFLAFLLINLLRGPTCICHILTAVQQDQLPSLNRLRVARRVIATLRLAIERVQGRLTPEEVKAGQSDVIAHPAPSLQYVRRPRAGEQQIRHDDGTMHMIAFAFILASGILTGIDLLHHSTAISVLTTLLTAIYSICLIVALVKQHHSDIPGTVQKMTWASLGFIFISFCLSYVLIAATFPALMATRSREIITQWDMYRALIDLSPRDSRIAMIVYVFSAAWATTLGALGLIGAISHRRLSSRIVGRYLDRGNEIRR